MSESQVENQQDDTKATQNKTIWTPYSSSPLSHVDVIKTQSNSTIDCSVHMNELSELGHLILRGDINSTEFTSSVEESLQIQFPKSIHSTVKNDSIRFFTISPDEWLIICQPNKVRNIESDLRKKLTGHFAITDISGAQTLIELSGKNAKNILKKSTSYDVDLKNFPVGKFIGTIFAKSQIQIYRTGNESFELIIRRSFADYLWQWLMRTGQEYAIEFSRNY